MSVPWMVFPMAFPTHVPGDPGGHHSREHAWETAPQVPSTLSTQSDCPHIYNTIDLRFVIELLYYLRWVPLSMYTIQMSNPVSWAESNEEFLCSVAFLVQARAIRSTPRLSSPSASSSSLPLSSSPPQHHPQPHHQQHPWWAQYSVVAFSIDFFPCPRHSSADNLIHRVAHWWTCLMTATRSPNPMHILGQIQIPNWACHFFRLKFFSIMVSFRNSGR